MLHSRNKRELLRNFAPFLARIMQKMLITRWLYGNNAYLCSLK